MKTWAERQLKEAKQRAQEHWGPAWRLLTPEMRQAYIAREALGVISGHEGEEGLEPAMRRMIELATLALKDPVQ